MSGEPQRILVAQMTRMGDMLQTTPLVRAIAQRYPGAHIAVMVRAMGRAIAERVPEISEVIVYDEDHMFRDLRARDSLRLLRAYRTAETLIETIRNGRYDVVYNCTNSIASAMLLKLAGVPQVVGAHLSEDWQFVLRGPWIVYFFTGVFHRAYNALNLCDIFGHFAGADPPRHLVFDLTETDRAAAARILAAKGIAPGTPYVCFQLGASDAKKRWAVEHFARLAQLIQERIGARVVLVGVKDEAPLGDALLAHAPQCGAVPLFGETKLPELGAVLEGAKALVSNDTGTMHIAAAVGCRVVLTSVGYVHFRETGPYGSGHCAIEARHPGLARWDASDAAAKSWHMHPEQVWHALELTLTTPAEGPVPQLEAAPGLDDVDVYVSRFAPDGCLDWYPVIPRAVTRADILRIAYRAMWLERLRGRPGGDAETTALEAMLACHGPADRADRGALIQPFLELAAMAAEGAAGAQDLVKHITGGGSMRDAKDRVARLMALDERTRLFGELHEHVRPLVMIARFERDNLEGADPRQLAETTVHIYRELEARASAMATKLDKVMALAT